MWMWMEKLVISFLLDIVQGRATPGTRAVLSGTWARPQKRDPHSLKVSVSSFLFVNNPLFTSILKCFFMPDGYKQSHINRTPYPLIGKARCHRGPKFRLLTTNFGWHVEKFCHWFSWFQHANWKRLPAPDIVFTQMKIFTCNLWWYLCVNTLRAGVWYIRTSISA